MEWRPVVLYGCTGWEAESFYFQYASRDNISFFTDRNAAGEFHGRKIISITEIPDLAQKLIVVATKWSEFKKIKHEFEDQGFKEFKNFCFWEACIKKIAILHANCNGFAYSEFLRKSQDFVGEYFLYPIPAICDIKNSNIDDSLLLECDLFIHQEIRKENEFGYCLSDEYILPRLKKGCKTLIIPKLGGWANLYYPSTYFTGAPKLLLENVTQNVLFAGNRLIDERFQEGKTLDEIMRDFLNVNIVSFEEKKRHKAELENKIKLLKEREKTWDIKISDYVIEHYQDEKLFTDNIHPSRSFILELCRRIGKALGLTDIDDICIDYDYEYQEMFVMPWVKAALGLKFDEKYIRTNLKTSQETGNKLTDGSMDLREYIREYIYWKFGKFLD